MTRIELAELLLRLIESLDKKDTQFKRKLYNIVLLSLDLFETTSQKYGSDNFLAASVIRQVGEHYRVQPDYYLMKSRKRELVKARQAAMTLIDINTKLTQDEIANMFSGKDHATLIHSKKTVSNLFDTDKSFKYDFLYLVRKLELKYIN